MKCAAAANCEFFTAEVSDRVVVLARPDSDLGLRAGHSAMCYLTLRMGATAAAPARAQVPATTYRTV